MARAKIGEASAARVGRAAAAVRLRSSVGGSGAQDVALVGHGAGRRDVTQIVAQASASGAQRAQVSAGHCRS
jgi:hypothetical protein